MEKIKNRSEIDDKYKWDLTKIYKNKSDIQKDIKIIKKQANILSKYQNHLLDDALTLLKATELFFSISQIFENLYVYANMLFHEDMSLDESKILVGKIDLLEVEIDQKIIFYIPELLKGDYTKIKTFMSLEKELKKYKHYFDKIFRKKKYILSLEEEQLLTKLNEVFESSEKTYDTLVNVDMKFSNIKDKDGKKIEMNETVYYRCLESSDRNIRKDAFKSLYSQYQNMINTLSLTFKGNIKTYAITSKIRGYKSSLERSLYNDAIDLKLYDKLINKARANVNLLQDYMKLRKDILKLDELHFYDLYAPIIPGISKKYSFEEALELINKALKPLGNKYIEDLGKLFNSKSIDVFNSKNKRSDAYSWGSYKKDPYILLNYDGSFNDISSLAHEAGHAMHSYYSDKANLYHDASYPIFLAEIASIVNEILLNKYCYNNAKTKKEKLYFLNNLLNDFRAAFFRQTLFAEFEKIVYEKEQNEEILTSEIISNTYLNLLKDYYSDCVYYDNEIKTEWARIDHFYRSFYVYKYATGIAIAWSIVSDILNNKEKSLDNYLDFLASGGKDYPLNILKKVGIDIVNDDTIDKAINMFQEILEEFKNIYYH